MKKLAFMALCAAFAMPQAAEAELIVGFEDFVDLGGDTDQFAATQQILGTGLVQGTVTNGQGGIGGFTNTGAMNGASADGTFGSNITAMASTDRANSTAAVALVNGAEGFFDFTITATAAVEVGSFNFDSFRRFGGSADEFVLSIESGSITNGVIGSGTITQAANGATPFEGVLNTDFDFDLSGLADRTLEIGESAVFRLAFTSGGGGGGNNTFIDNVGIFNVSATAIPEPSSLLVMGLIGAVGFGRRRRASAA